MTRGWWAENWFAVFIAAVVVGSIVAALIWPDAHFGCSVHIESKPS